MEAAVLLLGLLGFLLKNNRKEDCEYECYDEYSSDDNFDLHACENDCKDEYGFPSGNFISRIVSKIATEKSSEKIPELETALYNCESISTGSCSNVKVSCAGLSQSNITDTCQSDIAGCVENLVGCLEA